MRYFGAAGSEDNTVEPLFWLSLLMKADPVEAKLQTFSENQSGTFDLCWSKQQRSHYRPAYSFTPHISIIERKGPRVADCCSIQEYAKEWR